MSNHSTSFPVAPADDFNVRRDSYGIHMDMVLYFIFCVLLLLIVSVEKLSDNAHCLDWNDSVVLALGLADGTLMIRTSDLNEWTTKEAHDIGVLCLKWNNGKLVTGRKNNKDLNYDHTMNDD